MKKTLEQGVEENALELALRGEPRDPFYMVGRMGDQSVVIRAEKGKVKMLVDDDKELIYDATKGADDESQNPPGVRPEREDHRRVVDLDRTKDAVPALQGDEGELGAARPVAEPGHGGDAQRLIPEEGVPQTVERAAAPADRQATGQWQPGQTGPAIEKDPEKSQLMIMGAEDGPAIETDQGQTAGPGDHEGALRADKRQSGGRRTGGIA